MLVADDNYTHWPGAKLVLFELCQEVLTLSCSANERTEMKLKIYLSEAWMCSEFGMLITDVERERVKRIGYFVQVLKGYEDGS